MAQGPQITEEYQRKLQAFLVRFPKGSVEVESGTPHLKWPFTRDQFNAIKDSCQTNDVFNLYTGWQHKSLLERWFVDRTTTCNEFCQLCANKMGVGADITLGRFDIADWLANRGLAHCWVRADSGAEPVFGDIFRLAGADPDANGVRLNHMAVVNYVDGGRFYSMDAGQGGPSQGCDKIRSKNRAWPPPGLRGWVSIKALLNSKVPLPPWLGGWWQIEENIYDTYFYYFSANGKVTCTSHRPVNITAPPTDNSLLVGTFSSKKMFEVEIRWHGDVVAETLTCISNPRERKYSIVGKTKNEVKLTGQRLMVKVATDDN